ncbi:uncharacterized protein LOC107982222 [Nasonia vitripennis]|uniref:Uncharacterized protein n=1 Tax=Nasonia vitripennis TaxID=7425 RepID=A0A7M7IW25_NASVI|nr:uncharacterized protein LOC107982222 [Nasonia vitripennis]
MFPKHFLTLCGLVLFVAIASGVSARSAEESEVPQNEVSHGAEEDNPLLAAAVRILARAFAWAAKHCLEQAANACKQNWKHPGELVKCGGHWLAANKGRCVVG